jgi:ABC-type sugar transport system substrate-binding protein
VIPAEIKSERRARRSAQEEETEEMVEDHMSRTTVTFRKRCGAAFFAALSAVVMAGASQLVSAQPASAEAIPPKNGTQYVIGWSFHNDPLNEFWKLFIESMTATLEKGGAKVIFCSGQGDATKQANCVDQFLIQKVDAIVIASTDSAAIVGPTQKANDAGIPVFMWLNGVAASSGVKIVMGNETGDEPAGSGAGQAIVDALTAKYGSPKGKVLEIQGLMTQTLAQVRSAGLHKVVDKYPEIQVTTKAADWDTGKATTIIQDWITANPDADAIWLASDANYTPAVKAALSAVGRWVKAGEEGHVIVVGMDGSNIAVNAAKCGYMDYVADFTFPLISPVLADQVLTYLKTGSAAKVGDVVPVENSTITGVPVIERPEFVGPILSIPIFGVTPKTAENPLLFANKYQGAPNGLSACE